MDGNDAALQFLLSSRDPSVRYFALTDILGAAQNSEEVRAAREAIPHGPRACALLKGQGAGKRKTIESLALHGAGFGVHPYKKWEGAHWRLVSLVELGIPQDFEPARAAADQVLCWLTSDTHRRRIQPIRGRTRRCASQEGNALAVCSRLGLAADPRVKYLANSLVEWQWQDGGWNCDTRPQADHSSFYESLAPLWGLIEYHRVTEDRAVRDAAENTAEMFLRHSLFRSEKNGQVIDAEWLKLHYPVYWHYDILQGLLVLSRNGRAGDPRAKQALDILESKRETDGAWHADGFYWRSRGKGKSNVDVVDWGRKGPNEMITLNALRVLKATGRL